MASPLRILFVCMGNICRSPAGENVMRHMVKKARLSSAIACDSAGTIGYHVNEKPDERMILSASKRGIQFSGRSRRFSPRDFSDFDLIIPMDHANTRDILVLAKDVDSSQKVTPFCEFVENFDAQEVPDPYYGGEAGFDHVMDLMEDGCQNLLNQMVSKYSLSPSS
jgi:protein-tyrosine phosphatase